MCGGGACAGDILFTVEKLVTYLALTAVIVCIIITIIVSLGVGAGIGYNYCFVDQGAKIAAAHQVGKPRDSARMKSREFEMSPEDFDPGYAGNADHDDDDTRRSGVKRISGARNVAKEPSGPRRTTLRDDDKYTLTLKLHDNVDISSLIARLRGRNKNVTLEFIT